MEATQALTIVRALADGVDPQTGEVLPEGSPFQRSQTTRALFLAAQALERLGERQQREKRLPAQAGQPWDRDEDAQLRQRFAAGAVVRELARTHERTEGAIQSRMERLGLLPTPSASSPAQTHGNHEGF
jgi:hypothetical protein